MSTPTNHDSPTITTNNLTNGSDEMSFNPILLGSMSDSTNNNEATITSLQPESNDDNNNINTLQEEQHENNTSTTTPSSCTQQLVEGSMESNIMSESKLSEQEKQSLVSELSKVILGIYMNNVIQTSVKDKITETATDFTTANILSYYYKRREQLKQQQLLEQQQNQQQQLEQQEELKLLEQQSEVKTTIEKEEGLISLDRPANLDDSLIRIDLNDENQPAFENNSSNGNNTLEDDVVMTDQLSNIIQQESNQQLNNNNTDNNNNNITVVVNLNHQEESINQHDQLNNNHQQYDNNQNNNQLNNQLNQNNNNQLNNQHLKDVETDEENEEEEFYKKYMNDFRNDDLIVNKYEDLYPTCENSSSYIDHFREAILLEWNEFKKPIEFKYEYIQTRIEQLKKDFNIISQLINENIDTKYSNNNNNDLNCSKLSGFSNSDKNNTMINRSSELYNAFYTPHKRRLDLLQHPFFGSFQDVFNREIEHLNQLKEKQSDLTIISSNWVSATSTNLNDNNNNNINSNNLKITYPFPYITMLDILDSIELFKTSSNCYPAQSRALPLSFSTILKLNNNNSNINRRNVSSSNRRGRRGGNNSGNSNRPLSKRVIRSSNATNSTSSHHNKSSHMNDYEYEEEEFVMFTDVNNVKDVKAAEITVPSFRILTNEQLSQLSDDDNGDDIYSEDEDISDVKYCYLHIDKEMQERQKYYIASLPADKKKKKGLDQDSKNLHYNIPDHDTFKLAFEKFNFNTSTSTNSNTLNEQRFNNHNSLDLSTPPTPLTSGKNLISMNAKGHASTTLISTLNNNNSSITSTLTFNEKLTYLVPIEDLQQYSSQQQQSTTPLTSSSTGGTSSSSGGGGGGPMNAKLAFSKQQFQSKLGSPQKKKDLKKELTSIPRWKLISIESYVPYPILKKSDDPRGNWNDLKLKSLERRSNLSLDLNTDINNNIIMNHSINNNNNTSIFNDFDHSINTTTTTIIGNNNRKRSKSQVDDQDLITTGSLIKSNSSTTPYQSLQSQPKKKSKYEFDDHMLLADEDTDEIEDTDDDDFKQIDDEETDSDSDDLISTPKHSNNISNINNTAVVVNTPSSSNNNNTSITSNNNSITTTPTKSNSKKTKKKKSTSKKKKNQITTPVRVDKVMNDGTKLVFKLQK